MIDEKTVYEVHSNIMRQNSASYYSVIEFTRAIERLAAEEMRERCAKVCEASDDFTDYPEWTSARRGCADDIRKLEI